MRIAAERLFVGLVLALVAWNLSGAISPEIETNLLQGRWQKVYDLISADSTLIQDPVARLLMGHACLATYQNYGASKMFSTTGKPEELNSWSTFATALKEKYPDKAIAVYLEADAQFRRDHLDEAINGFAMASALDGNMAIAYYQRAMANLRRGKGTAAAIADLNSAIGADPRFARAYFDLGNLFVDLDKYEESIMYFTRAIEVDSAYAEAYFNRANTQQRHGKYDQAILDYDQALQLQPMWAEAFYNRGNVFLFGKQEYMSAIFDFDKALRINSKYADAHYNRGVAYARLGQPQKAVSDFSRVIELSPNDARGYSNRANAFMQLERLENALADYNKAIELDPNLAEAYENRGVLYMTKLGQVEKACADWRRACELGSCKNYDLAVANGDCQ